MPKYTLHYFAGNGRAAIARAILSFAKAYTICILFNHSYPYLYLNLLLELNTLMLFNSSLVENFPVVFYQMKLVI